MGSEKHAENALYCRLILTLCQNDMIANDYDLHYHNDRIS